MNPVPQGTVFGQEAGRIQWVNITARKPDQQISNPEKLAELSDAHVMEVLVDTLTPDGPDDPE